MVLHINQEYRIVFCFEGPNAAALYGSRAGNGVILILRQRKVVRRMVFGMRYGELGQVETLDMQSLRTGTY